MTRVLSVVFVFLSLSCVSHASSYFDGFVGTYAAYDGYWAHPFQTSVTIRSVNGRPMLRTGNLAQQTGCAALPGALVGLVQRDDGSAVATYRLQKSPGCQIEGNEVRVTFAPGASGCSEFSPRVTIQYLRRGPSSGRYGRAVTVYWGLVKAGACR